MSAGNGTRATGLAVSIGNDTMASEPGNTLTDTDPIAVSAGNGTRATGLAVCVGNDTMANEPRNTLTDPEIWDKIEAILSSIVIAES